MLIHYQDDGACAGCSQDDASKYFPDEQPFSGARKTPEWNKKFDHLARLEPNLLFGWNSYGRKDASGLSQWHIGIIQYRDFTKSTMPPYFRLLVIDCTPSRRREAVIVMINYLKYLGLNHEQFEHVFKVFGVKPVKLKRLSKMINSWPR